MKTWKSNFKEDKLRIFYTNDYLDNLIKNTRLPNLSLSDIGFKKSSIEVPDYTVTKTMMRAYDDQRNLPAKEGTSRLSVHLRFGTVSIRKMVKKSDSGKR